MITLLASRTETTSGAALITTVRHPDLVESGVFVLTVSDAGTLVGDLLDVYVQSSVEDTKWDDFIHFTQVLGNGGGLRHLAKWIRNGTPSTSMSLLTDGGTMAVGVAHGPVGASWRVKWVIANGGGTHSFTFSLVADMVLRES